MSSSLSATRTYSSPNLRGASAPHTWIIKTRAWDAPNIATQCDRYDYSQETDAGDNFNTTKTGNSAMEADQDFYIIGDRVYVDGFRLASVAYFGELDFATGDWVGVVLDEPTGNHAGKVHGHEYFQCAPFHGVFVRPHRIRRVPDSALGSSATSSRAPTPLPTSDNQFSRSRCSSSRCASKSPGTSTLDSYYYDEDYRQEKKPTVESLTRKLRSIDERRSDAVHPSESGSASRRDSLDPQQPRYHSILKTNSRSRSLSTNHNEDSDYRARRSKSLLDTSRGDPPQATSVFNFRPKREQLDSPRQHSVSSDRLDRQTNSRSGSLMDVDTSYTGGRVSVDLSSVANIGDRVKVRAERGHLIGTLRYVGETKFATGEWAGVELDRPEGKNDGTVLGVRYFYCPNNHGLFVPATRVKKIRDGEENSVFNGIRSTLLSPPPAARSAYSSGSLSTTPSYTDRSATPSSTYGSKAASPAPFDDDRYLHSTASVKSEWLDDYYNRHSPLRGSSNYSRPRFDDADIDYQLRRILNQPRQPNWSDLSFERSRCIKYTFSASKYNGNPIVRKTVEYN